MRFKIGARDLSGRILSLSKDEGRTPVH
jgi:hypothetical protein